MKNMMLAAVLALISSQSAWGASFGNIDLLRQGCGFDGAVCAVAPTAVAAAGGETERYIKEEIDKTSGLSGTLLEETRKGEAEAIGRMIDESPTLRKAIDNAGKGRTWRDFYEDRITDAAVASWGSNLKAGYLKGTAAAYATYKTAPAGVNVLAGGALWIAGVVYGLGLTLLAAALTGHL